MERTVDILICHYSGDDIKTLILRDMKQLLAELNDRISFMGSSKESAQSELANFHKENPDFLAILEREKLALQVQESKLSQFTFEEARIEADIQKLMEMKESVVSQKSSAAEIVEEGKQKMDDLKNKH
jgi:peptidoglycan hydrolase CwlO-like protein